MALILLFATLVAAGTSAKQKQRRRFRFALVVEGHDERSLTSVTRPCRITETKSPVHSAWMTDGSRTETGGSWTPPVSGDGPGNLGGPSKQQLWGKLPRRKR